MGTFGGHALPGSFFIIFALWWTIQTFRKYYHSFRKTSPSYHSTSTFTCYCCCCPPLLRDWQWEGALKLFFTSVGFTLEIITGFKDGQFVYIGNGQHATMFFFFGLSGLVDILLHYKVPLPKGVDYLSMALAFAVEALLFKFHLDGRPTMDVLLHTLLLYTIYANCASTLLELRFPHNPLIALSRAYFTFLQGTWFWQIGFILYSPLPDAEPWEQENHAQIMVVTMLYCWHAAAVMLVMLTVGTGIGCMYYCCAGVRPMNRKKLDLGQSLLANEEQESDSSL